MENMKDDLISKLKRMVTEPKIFSLLLSSDKGQLLYLGIHFSLEEAYSSAKEKMSSLPHVRREESIDIELWNSIPARHVISQIIDPSYFGPEIGMADGATNRAPGDIEYIKEILNLDEILKNNKMKGVDGKEVDGSVTDDVKEIRRLKNKLIKKIITSENQEGIEDAKSVLGSSSIKYITEKIKEKDTKINKEEGK